MFWFSILWGFGYDLTKLLIIDNVKVPCNNMTVIIIYKKIAIIIIATFNLIRVFKEFNNIQLKHKLFILWNDEEY